MCVVAEALGASGVVGAVVGVVGGGEAGVGVAAVGGGRAAGGGVCAAEQPATNMINFNLVDNDHLQGNCSQTNTNQQKLHRSSAYKKQQIHHHCGTLSQTQLAETTGATDIADTCQAR